MRKQNQWFRVVVFAGMCVYGGGGLAVETTPPIIDAINRGAEESGLAATTEWMLIEPDLEQQALISILREAGIDTARTDISQIEVNQAFESYVYRHRVSPETLLRLYNYLLISIQLARTEEESKAYNALLALVLLPYMDEGGFCQGDLFSDDGKSCALARGAPGVLVEAAKETPDGVYVPFPGNDPGPTHSELQEILDFVMGWATVPPVHASNHAKPTAVAHAGNLLRAVYKNTRQVFANGFRKVSAECDASLDLSNRTRATIVGIFSIPVIAAGAIVTLIPVVGPIVGPLVIAVGFIAGVAGVFADAATGTLSQTLCANQVSDRVLQVAGSAVPYRMIYGTGYQARYRIKSGFFGWGASASVWGEFYGVVNLQSDIKSSDVAFGVVPVAVHAKHAWRIYKLYACINEESNNRSEAIVACVQKYASTPEWKLRNGVTTLTHAYNRNCGLSPQPPGSRPAYAAIEAGAIKIPYGVRFGTYDQESPVAGSPTVQAGVVGMFPQPTLAVEPRMGEPEGMFLLSTVRAWHTNAIYSGLDAINLTSSMCKASGRTTGASGDRASSDMAEIKGDAVWRYKTSPNIPPFPPSCSITFGSCFSGVDAPLDPVDIKIGFYAGHDPITSNGSQPYTP